MVAPMKAGGGGSAEAPKGKAPLSTLALETPAGGGVACQKLMQKGKGATGFRSVSY